VNYCPPYLELASDCIKGYSPVPRWIVWKLASYERVFSAVCSGKALNRDAVFQQLKHRWGLLAAELCCSMLV
jgi:hypothetical protein